MTESGTRKNCSPAWPAIPPRTSEAPVLADVSRYPDVAEGSGVFCRAGRTARPAAPPPPPPSSRGGRVRPGGCRALPGLTPAPDRRGRRRPPRRSRSPQPPAEAIRSSASTVSSAIRTSRHRAARNSASSRIRRAACSMTAASRSASQSRRRAHRAAGLRPPVIIQAAQPGSPHQVVMRRPARWPGLPRPPSSQPGPGPAAGGRVRVPGSGPPMSSRNGGYSSVISPAYPATRSTHRFRPSTKS